jgi:hypothetical protein
MLAFKEKNMYKKIGLVLSFLALTAFGNNKEYTYKNHIFLAVVKNVRLQAELVEQGKKDNDVVSVDVPAVLFDKPIKIVDVRRNKESFSKEIDFLVAYTKANIEGTKEDILSFWHPIVRESIRKSVEDKEMFKKNREYMLKNPGLVIIGLVKHKDSVSILEGDTIVLGVTIKSENGKLYLIEKPDNDMELAIIEASFNE